MADVISS